jgi:hypothetical protein
MDQKQSFADWVIQQIGPLGVFLIVIAILFFFFYILSRWREWNFARSRRGYDVESFVRDMADRGVDEIVSRTGYEVMQREQKVRFPILPEDELDELLGIAGEDLNETMQSIMSRTGRLKTLGLRQMPHETVADMLKYVQASPPAQPRPDGAKKLA